MRRARAARACVEGVAAQGRAPRPAAAHLDGGPDGRPCYDIDGIAAAVQEAVTAARFHAPVVVGHSLAAVIATVYAARYPARGVVNVDQPLQVAPLADA